MNAFHLSIFALLVFTTVQCKLTIWRECEEKAFNDVAKIFQIINEEESKSCQKYQDCHGNGKCIPGGVCLCNEGFAGLDCGKTAEPQKVVGDQVVINTESFGPMEAWLKEQNLNKVTVSWPTRSGISEVEALEHCKNVWIDNPYNSVCQKFFTTDDYAKFVRLCTQIIKVTSQLGFAEKFRDNTAFFCISEIVDDSKKECNNAQ